MIKLKIAPQARAERNRKGKIIKPFTVFAVEHKLRRSQKPYQQWVAQKRKELENQPRWLKNAWEEFFEKTSY